MLGKPRILSFFPTRLINSIKHEHSCKILYLIKFCMDLHVALGWRGDADLILRSLWDGGASKEKQTDFAFLRDRRPFCGEKRTNFAK